jgi:hypothetical protein
MMLLMSRQAAIIRMDISVEAAASMMGMGWSVKTVTKLRFLGMRK